MRSVVIDTNVFLSAVLGGALATILDQWRAEKFTLIVSDEIVSEYIEVIRRDKFGLPSEVIDDISAYLLHKAEFVMPAERITVVESDPDDNKFIEAAVAGNAERIVSGDKHLLKLEVYRNIPIIKARQFLDELEEGSSVSKV